MKCLLSTNIPRVAITYTNGQISQDPSQGRQIMPSHATFVTMVRGEALQKQ